MADCTLAVIGLPEIYIELKSPPNKPTEAQLAFAAAVERVGRKWYWADSVGRFHQCLVAAGVPLRPNAALQAEHLDRLLLAGKMKREGAAPKGYRKPRAPKPSAARLAAVHRGPYWRG